MHPIASVRTVPFSFLARDYEARHGLATGNVADVIPPPEGARCILLTCPRRFHNSMRSSRVLTEGLLNL